MTIDRSALMKRAWRIARILDGVEGTSALDHLSDTMKSSWAIARREAAAAADGAVEIVQQVQQQATGPFDALALQAGYTGTDRTITAASTIYAVHGADGIEDPLIGDLEWLRLLLRNCQNPGAFKALMGGSDDPDPTLMMIWCVEDLYRRLATLVGHRPDIYDRERDMKDFA